MLNINLLFFKNLLLQWPAIFEVQIIFEVPDPVHEYTEMRIPNRKYQTNTVGTFQGSSSASALKYLGVGFW